MSDCTVLTVTAALAQGTRGRILNAFAEKTIIDVAKVKRDLRLEGCNGPAESEKIHLLQGLHPIHATKMNFIHHFHQQYGI